MDEIIFVVEDAPDGGLTARAVGESIFTQAATMPELHDRVRDAVRCHFEDGTQRRLTLPSCTWPLQTPPPKPPSAIPAKA